MTDEPLASGLEGETLEAARRSAGTGEALIYGRSIPAPLLVKIGTKALVHGGESPEVLDLWGRFGA